MADVNFVVTCTQRKRFPVPETLRLSSVPADPADRRLAAWVERLESVDGPKSQVLQMYQGEQWAGVRQLNEELGGKRRVHVWVLSAGYGLIPEEAQIHPYAATFSRNQKDSVCAPGSTDCSDTVSKWWTELSEWEGPASAPRSLTALAEAEPDIPIVIAASPDYLAAAEQDLARCRLALGCPQSLLVFSAGAGKGTLRDVGVLSFDRRLSQLLGGSMMSLNTRAAAAVLKSETRLRHDDAQRRLDEWLKDIPRPKAIARLRATDTDVKRFVADELDENPNGKWSVLLKKFRKQSGRACEQSRFRGLFFAVAGGRSAAGTET